MEKKAKYFIEIKNQINEKNIILQEKMNRIKEEQLIKRKKDKEREEIENLIKAKLTKRYQEIIEETKKYESYLTEKMRWQTRRNNNKDIRKVLYATLFSRDIDNDKIFNQKSIIPEQTFIKNYLQNFEKRNDSLNEKIINFSSSSALLPTENKTIKKYPYKLEEHQKLNYHIITIEKFLRESEKNDNENLIRSRLIDNILEEKEIKLNINRSSEFDKISRINNIFSNKSSTEINNIIDIEEVKIKIDEMNISDENTKIINNKNYDNELLMNEFIKSNFVLPIINKCLTYIEEINNKKVEQSKI